ncbi:hypothetical protein AKJ37_07520 [candidate division MSBL1 archaeon SCGC-AAA259I09]|uniref:Transposase IS4-like domain-containing protein n=1 Tax=candidate division MSBL1 archaeon SCGC-AAA259I09 TaxID=1698267 RepID=A0A133UK92_9EURY|nr:hypothetical protein AKJ37_07520 [candidate division MSBL1 archaeon SCGC-AAA259I09]
MELSVDKRSSGTYYRIRESYREGGKVKKRTIRYLGTLENILERFSKPIVEDVELETVSFGPAAALRWAFEDLGLDDLFTNFLDPEENHGFPAWKKIFLLVWRRFFQDMSMRAAVEMYDEQVFPFWWREDITTVQRFYQFLAESLSEEKIETLQEELASRVIDGEQVEECWLDTTNYCTYVRDDTKYLRMGKSKDRVVGRRLVGLSLVLTEGGLPVLSTAYPGNRHDSKLFSELFGKVCQRIESLGSDLEEVTIVFDRGFDDGDNYDLSRLSQPHIVAGVKKNWKSVRAKIDAADLDEFQLSHETEHGKCYVKDSGSVRIGKGKWRIVLSYHDTTREKIREKMEEARSETEDLLDHLREKIKKRGRGRPITEDGIEEELREVLGKWYGCLDWSFDSEERSLEVEGWNEKWNRYYETAGVHAIITDHEDWSPSKVVRTYFGRKELESMFHLTKKALVVPVEPPYVKEDHLVRAHLFLIFIGLLCYQHIRKELPENLSDEKIKSAMKMLKMVIAVEDESLQFRLANVNEKTKPILSTLGLKKYLPE